MQYFFQASAEQALHQLETKYTICMPTDTFTVIFSTYQQLVTNVLRKLLNNIILIYGCLKWNQNESSQSTGKSHLKGDKNMNSPSKAITLFKLTFYTLTLLKQVTKFLRLKPKLKSSPRKKGKLINAIYHIFATSSRL